MVHILKKIAVGLCISLTVFSCATDSKITSSYTSKKLVKSYNDVVIVALTHDVAAKKLVETDLSDALKKKGVMTYKSLDVFPLDFSGDTPKAEMLSSIRKTGAEGIITISLLDKESKHRYVPGYPGYMPGFYGYYTFWYPTVYSPGYYTEDRVYYIETNFYDADTDELVWSARSETYNPASLTGFSVDLAKILAAKLEKDRIISPSFGDKKIESRLNH